MRTFTYTRFMGDRRTVTADRVEFGPAHVVFRMRNGRVVIAEQVRQVNELEETTE
jgi:hypothetical protein